MMNTSISHKWAQVVLLCTFGIPATATAGPLEVEMPEFATEHMKKLMRGHLNTLQEVSLLLSRHEYEQAADTAEQGLGMSSVEVHFERYVGKYMPDEMRAQGRNMHGAATRFAADARNAAEGKQLDKALASLSEMMKQCVSCHSVYRLRQSEN